MSWIDIDKRLPKTYLPILVFTKSEIQVVACLFRKKNKTRKVNKFMTIIGGDGKERIIEDVTHWMRLPKDPV